MAVPRYCIVFTVWIGLLVALICILLLSERIASKYIFIALFAIASAMLIIRTCILGGGGFKKTESVNTQPIENDSFVRTTEYFISENTKCEAWLFMPKGAENPPIIIMAGGFGTQKDFKMDFYAEYFAKNKIAVFQFDYRTFGGSDGYPRNNVSVSGHLKDWKNAVDHVIKNVKGVNSQKIGLWGSSYSGGHVLVTAATHLQKDKIIAVSGQVPFIDGIASLLSITKQVGLSWLLNLLGLGIRDLLRTVFCCGRAYVPIFAKTDESGIFVTPECYDGYSGIIPSDPIGGWQNLCPGLCPLQILFYRPTSYVRNINAQVLLLYGKNDSLCPLPALLAAAKKIKNCTLEERDSGHFNVYYPPLSDDVVKTQSDFFKKHFAMN